MSHTLAHLLKPFRPYLDDPGVEDICVNEPGHCFIYASGGFSKQPLDLRAFDIENVAIVAAAQRRRNAGPNDPLVGTDLPGDGRLNVVLPPHVEEGKPSLTIRRGSSFSPSLAQLGAGGLFDQTRGRARIRNAADVRLMELYRAEKWQQFFHQAVLAKKTIVACGETGSGKTTFAKALIDSIPREERLITIEDTPEWTNLPHENKVCMFYDKHGKIQAADLVQAALRMRIGRLLVQELRDGRAANGFLEALQTGTPGGITTIHAMDCKQTFVRLKTMIKQTDGGAALDDRDLISQLHSLIDIVVHCERPPGGAFALSEVWFAPVSLENETLAA
jgi:type IV secretion system protein VirB11